MAESLQKWVGRNRPPRVQITYDVEIGDAIEKRELPLVVGVLADLAGKPASAPPKMKDRRFVEIDRDNFDEIMAKIGPRLDMSVPDMMKGSGNLKIELTPKKFADFHPEAIVDQVPRLKKLLEARLELRDLAERIERREQLRAELQLTQHAIDKAKARVIDQIQDAARIEQERLSVTRLRSQLVAVMADKLLNKLR